MYSQILHTSFRLSFSFSSIFFTLSSSAFLLPYLSFLLTKCQIFVSEPDNVGLVGGLAVEGVAGAAADSHPLGSALNGHLQVKKEADRKGIKPL